jgi:hypothetical protein
MSTQDDLAYRQCASVGFVSTYFPRRDVTSAFVLPLRNGMVDVCMISRDSVVNSKDLHAAMAQSATLRIAIDLHARISPALGRASGLPIMQPVFSSAQGSPRTRSMSGERIPSALDMHCDWPLRSICTIASIWTETVRSSALFAKFPCQKCVQGSLCTSDNVHKTGGHRDR